MFVTDPLASCSLIKYIKYIDPSETERFNPLSIKPLPVKLCYFNFHPLAVVSRYSDPLEVSRYRDPQFQVREIYSYLLTLRPKICKYRSLNTRIIHSNCYPADKTYKKRF